VTQNGEKVMTEVTQKQLHYFSITPRLKRLFVSKRTMRHMRWHKESIRENDGVTGHPSDGEAWKVGLMQTLLVMQEMFASGW
jgi:alkylated DNA repair dioxygenase AlkB